MDIKTYVLKRKDILKQEISKSGATLNLIIIQVNDDFASNKYIGGKIKDAEEVGIRATLVKLDLMTSEEHVLSLIEKLNSDPIIHGIIVQLPLPRHISEEKIKMAISP
ncbi:MAG: tetrahydrofolate dehydrogenase/cyclohydrolase catalytic domain-containing protein, partial [Bacilli bacterium]